MQADSLDSLQAIVLRHAPELAGASFRVLDAGWDSIALEADDRWIFKFPRNEAAEASLIREAALLEAVRPHVRMRVPDLRVEEGPPVFSRHEKLPGDHLTSEQYARLSQGERRDLAAQMARFFADLHAVDPEAVRRAGAGAIGAWEPVAAIRAKALPMLPADVRAAAEACLVTYGALSPDPLGEVYGFFDGHGWNMAFDVEAGRLNGVYDFADSGFGPRHREFVYPGFIDLELVARIVAEYEAFTGLRLDRDRIQTLVGMLHLSELAEMGEDPAWAVRLLPYVERWARNGLPWVGGGSYPG